MFETPERSTIAAEQKGKHTSFDYLKRYKDAYWNLLKRANTLKGKDEARRTDLIKAAARMSRGKKGLSTEEVHRAAVIAEIDLLLDENKYGKTNGRK